MTYKQIIENHLDIQINLLSEREKKMMQMLQAFCDHHKLAIGKDPEIGELARRTELNEVLGDIKGNLPE